MSESGYSLASTSLPKVMLPHDAEQQDRALRELLRRCPADTIEAARRFRHSRRAIEIPTIVVGVLSRYVDHERKMTLQHPSDSLRLIEDLGLDSLSMIEISMTLEDVLEISLSDEKLRTFRTLGDIKGYAKSCLKS